MKPFTSQFFHVLDLELGPDVIRRAILRNIPNSQEYTHKEALLFPF